VLGTMDVTIWTVIGIARSPQTRGWIVSLERPGRTRPVIDQIHVDELPENLTLGSRVEHEIRVVTLV
jgi:hypothetical protein